jgi:hypothetical protein
MPSPASVLGKVADMESKPRTEPGQSPVPGVIPDPPTVHHDRASADKDSTAAPSARPGSAPATPSRRRNPARIVLAKLRSAFRGAPRMKER